MEYLVANGAERVIDELQEHTYQIQVDTVEALKVWSVGRIPLVMGMYVDSGVALASRLNKCFVFRHCVISSI